MLYLLFLFLIGLGVCIFVQYKKHEKIKDLYIEAKELETKNNGNPYNTVKLKQALTLYKQCLKLANKPVYTGFVVLLKYTITLFEKKETFKKNIVFCDGKHYYIKAVERCQQKINDYRKFHDTIDLARKQVQQKRFKEALANFTNASSIYRSDKLEHEILQCKENVLGQGNYEKALNRASTIARQGKFPEAIAIVEPELEKFNRDDGCKFLAKLQRVCAAKESYRLGLLAERNGTIQGAIKQYKEALKILPELVECQTRLAILNIKTNNPTGAISCLQGINNTQTNYLRGFAYSQKGNWQEANREWRSINRVSVDIQRSLLKQIIDRDRLNSIREIEQLLEQGQLEIAKSVSLEFIQKLDPDPIVKFNLENHIQPIIEKSTWDDGNWQKTVAKLEQVWLEQQDIKSLHNWAIATYYLAQTNPSKLPDFIIAWTTALANIEQNPTLQNVPWLGSNSIDLQDVSAKLKQVLENAIDNVKDRNINEYLNLRDIYRREMVALSLIQQNNSCGMRIKQQLFILPGCYQHFRARLPEIRFPAKFWGALYTDWGLAVAACHEGDTARAIKIKPSINPALNDRFAYYFVSYHEGCHYLQNLAWRKAVNPLQQAKYEIQAKSDWRKEIDRLCELQRQKINDFDEHLQFSESWYELLDSQPSRSYFAECKTREVARKLTNETISQQQGLKELREIQNIDRDNPLVLELIKAVETAQESERINSLLQQGKFAEAVREAKRSSNEDVRFRVAEICLEVIAKQLQSGNLSPDAVQALNEIAGWAYDLCPREPAFQPVFRKLREIGLRY